MKSLPEKNQKERTRDLLKTHYDHIMGMENIEPPIDIWTFLCSDEFLGKSTDNGKAIFPVWKKTLTNTFDDMSKTTVVLTGSVRTGKSTIALYGLAYVLYRLLNLKNPFAYFSLTKSSKMAIIFFNLNKSLGGSRGYSKFQATLVDSPWFRNKASYISETKVGEAFEFPKIEFLLASPNSRGFGIIGADVVSGILDEVDDEEAPLSQKRKVLSVFNAAEIRFKTSFCQDGFSLGKLFVVSSKTDELSFMDSFIAERKKFPEVLIFDIPMWEAQPQSKYCGETFPVAVGDAFNPPKVLEEGQQEEYIKKGYNILDVPVEYKTSFLTNLVRSLQQIAGVTTAGIRKSRLFASKQDILNCEDKTKENPVKVEEIITGLKDSLEFVKYFDLSKIRLGKDVPRFIHYDISYSGDGDACSLAMSAIKEWTLVDIQNEDGSYRKDAVPIVETDFVVRIKAHPGDRIPFWKVRKMVLDIRAAGFRIALFTADLDNMSEDTKQLLTQAGIPTDKLSLDRTIQPYFSFRDLVQEGRWICHNVPLLFTELDFLEHDKIENKVDHPDKFIYKELGKEDQVLKGSKDMADAVAGSVFSAIRASKKPINFDLLSKILDKTGSKSTEPDEDMTKLLRPSQGSPIIGTQQPGGAIDRINDIFKRLHPGR